MVNNTLNENINCGIKAGLIFIILLILFAHIGQAAIGDVAVIDRRVIIDGSIIRLFRLYVTITPTPSTIYPTTVNPGAYSEIKITVTNSSGAPIQGASLVLNTSGGNLQTYAGTTSSQGILITRFSSPVSGMFYVNVTASHPDYSWGGSNNVQITVLNRRPTATFSISSRTGTAPLTVRFDASGSTDIDGTITSYSWNFGDGSNGDGSTVTHTYENEGEYNPTLTITDNLGESDSFSDKIIVNPKPALLPLALSITSDPESVEPGEKSTITVTVTGSNNAPVSGVSVLLAPAQGSSVSPVSGSTDLNGRFISTFTASSEGTFSVKGIAKKVDFADGSKEIQLKVKKSEINIATTIPTATILPPASPTGAGGVGIVVQWIDILIVIFIIAVLAAIFLLRGKIGKSKEEEQVEKWKEEGYDVSGLERGHKK